MATTAVALLNRHVAHGEGCGCGTVAHQMAQLIPLRWLVYPHPRSLYMLRLLEGGDSFCQVHFFFPLRAQSRPCPPLEALALGVPRVPRFDIIPPHSLW
jgi:hypothetical protein